MDIVRAFGYIFEDEDWFSKLLIAAIVGIIPIVNFATWGWIIALIRNMLDGVEQPLPAWDDFGQKFIDGLFYAIAGLLYSLPMIVIAGVLVGMTAVFSNSRGVEGLLALVVCCLSAGTFVYAIVVSALTYIGAIRYSQERNFDVYLQAGANFSLAISNLGTLILLLVFLIIAGFIVGLFGLIPCIGWLAALALGTPVTAHLMGQAAIEILGKRKRKHSDEFI